MAQKPHSLPELRRWWKQFVGARYNIAELARQRGGACATWESRIRRARQVLKPREPKGEEYFRKPRVDVVSEGELRRTWAAYAEAGYNETRTSNAMNVARTSIQARLARCRAEFGLAEPPLEQRERQRLMDRNAELTKELRDTARTLNDAEDLRAALFSLTAQPLAPPQWLLKDPASHDIPGLPILFTSDFQWGEVIKADALGGVNEFNKDVASRRYKLLIEKTLELSFVHMPRAKYDGLLYLRGGDMISGEIHADLRESNDLQSVPAVRDLVEHECAGVEQLLKRFGKVHIVSVPGNHGRITPKPQAKGAIERNLDTLSAWWLESYWKREPRVTFQTPASGDAMLPVYGYRFLLTHGDRIGSRGGEGFIGAVATITRGMKKVADYYAALGQSLDLQFIGHFHTSLELEYGFANGSLPGYSEYARDLRMRPQPPKQWLVFAHPRHMVGARWPILLEQRPRLA